jgi:UPF0755 protein
MFKFLFRTLLLLLIAFVLWFAWIVALPVPLPIKPYNLTVGPNRTMGQLARALEREGVIRDRTVLVGIARIIGVERHLKPGLYAFNQPTAMWEILQRLADGRPDLSSVTLVEGTTFHQFRKQLDLAEDIQHTTASLTDVQLLAAIGVSEQYPEGLFFPSTYFYPPGSSDIEVFRHAYRIMQQELAVAWMQRVAGLPYQTPYELLTMASIVEKETARPQDRTLVAAVFTNRLKLGMRLQTDPSVIYGMGDDFNGNISKNDLRRDTPYNTYTRNGLTPTPIALPGHDSLLAAARPAPSKALYFVARGDGSSQFSETLDQHNAAVRKYILKRGS